jgi:uncharacterized lipoprotein YehR (DUF1307 family)
MKSSTLVVILASILFSITACNDTTQKKVTYKSSGAISDYTVQYRNDQQELVKITVEPESATDSWKYEYMADEGDIVYVSGIYKDINSALLIQVLVDGKVYKQGSNKADTVKYLTVSGVVPYD